ncbi:Abi family protein [Microbacterium sp. Marseille-Q6965]|uniref:Abi family protein n=1 Tax=Microbacterium sp. Marseille-Q6965 TaxID=2965072 RepID=UPI0028E0A405|nr:Abi family protein [Microbacterium sp. Marseille-Q6965]
MISGYPATGIPTVYPLRARTAPAITPHLRPGTTLVHVSDLYDFDRALRLLILGAIEMVEVALRFTVRHTLGRRSAFAHRSASRLDPAFSRERPQSTARTCPRGSPPRSSPSACSVNRLR